MRAIVCLINRKGEKFKILTFANLNNLDQMDLTVAERLEAERKILRIISKEQFNVELETLVKSKNIKRPKITALNPFIDQYGLIIRQRFYLLDGKNQIRKIIRNCITCICHRPIPIN